MNKKIIILISVLTVLITANFFNLYIKSGKELKNEYDNYVIFLKEAKTLKSLKNKYSEKSLKIIKNICKVNSGRIICKNLSKNSLRKINMFLKSNIKLKKFTIKNDNDKFDFYAEIVK